MPGRFSTVPRLVVGWLPAHQRACSLRASISIDQQRHKRNGRCNMKSIATSDFCQKSPQNVAGITTHVVPQTFAAGLSSDWMCFCTQRWAQRGRWPYVCAGIAGIAQLVEHQFPKLKVAGSNPVSRSLSVFVTTAPASFTLFWYTVTYVTALVRSVGHVLFQRFEALSSY